MDGATTFLVGYITAEGPDGCLKPEEIVDAIRNVPGSPVVHEGDGITVKWFVGAPMRCWLAVSEYQPDIASVFREAVACGVDLVLLWFDTDRRLADPAWAAAQDEYLNKCINAARAVGMGRN